MTQTSQDIRLFTNLPVKVMAVPGNRNFLLIVQTPHRGEVRIDTKQTHYPFLASVTQTDKSLDAILSQLRELEAEVKTFLFNKWRAKFD